jgi:hypothetical protein
MFFWYDHTRAAFYPPLASTFASLTEREQQFLSDEKIEQFVRDFLEDPQSVLVETERF